MMSARKEELPTDGTGNFKLEAKTESLLPGREFNVLVDPSKMLQAR